MGKRKKSSMKNIVITLILSLTLLSGCQTPDAPNKDWKGVARILPIIVADSNGNTRWTKSQLAKGFENTNLYWKQTGIQFKMIKPEIITHDRLYKQTGLVDFLNLMLISKKIAKKRNVYPVYFVDSIKWGKNVYAGMSTTADAPLGFQYGTVISSVIRGKSGRTISHELGHAWNLRHTWQDKLNDTISENSTDCNDKIHCNVMSYCFGQLDCKPLPFFSDNQITEIRTWALSKSRLHILETDINVPQAVLSLQKNFNLILDPAKNWNSEEVE